LLDGLGMGINMVREGTVYRFAGFLFLGLLNLFANVLGQGIITARRFRLLLTYRVGFSVV